MKTKRISVLLLIFCFFIGAYVATPMIASQSAQGGGGILDLNTGTPENYTLLAKIFGDDTASFQSNEGLFLYVSEFFNLLFLIGGTLAVVYIVLGGRDVYDRRNTRRYK